MDLRRVLIILLITSISFSSLALAKKERTEQDIKKDFEDVYQKSKESSSDKHLKNPSALFQMSEPMGYTKPYLPVFQEPKIIKVWIPPHKSKDDVNVLVSGHWVYVMVEDPSWFVENEISKDMSVGVIVPSLPQRE